MKYKKFKETNVKNFKYEKNKYGFHGDVLLFCEDLPENFDSFDLLKDGVIAEGESTGHAHVLFGDNYELRENPETKERHLKIVDTTLLKHQEHDPIEIRPGSYRIGIVKEYDHFTEETRRVLD